MKSYLSSTISFVVFVNLTASYVFGTVQLALTLEYAGSFDSGFNPISSVAFDGSQAVDPTWVHQLDVKIALSGQGANEDFWSVGFNIKGTNKLVPIDSGGGYWNPASGSYDSNGSSPGGIQSHWQAGNSDIGSNTNDLLSIIVEATSAEANNRQYGENSRPKTGFADSLGYPTHIGSIFLNYLATNHAFLTLDFIPGSPWGTYDGNSSGAGTRTSQPASSITGDTFVFMSDPSGYVFTGDDDSGFFVPEPGGLALLGLGGIAILRLKR